MEKGNQSQQQQPKIKYKPLHEIFQDPEHHQLSADDQDILLVKIEESLFFANTGQMKDRLRRAEAYGGWMHIHPSEEERRPIAPRGRALGGSGTNSARLSSSRPPESTSTVSSPTRSAPTQRSSVLELYAQPMESSTSLDDGDKIGGRCKSHQLSVHQS
jgi:hypothetical protein